MIAILLLCLLPTDTTTTETIDSLQCEHFYSDDARYIFSQFIFRDSYGDIIAWRMVKGDMWPRRTANGWELFWLDGSTWRRVRTKSFCETFSQQDTELIERINLPPSERQELLKPIR